MKRIALAIDFYVGTVFSHPNVWFMRAAETISPSPGERAGVRASFKPKLNGLRFFRQPLRRSGDSIGARSAADFKILLAPGSARFDEDAVNHVRLQFARFGARD